MSEPLHFSEKESEVMSTSKLIYKVILTYGDPEEIVRTAICPFDMEESTSLVNPSRSPIGWKHWIKRPHALRLRTATRKPLRVDGLVLFHLRPGDFSRAFWSALLPTLLLTSHSAGHLPTGLYA